jgi:hypothetical protein
MVTLSEAGIALILLEQELRNDLDEACRWERRVKQADTERKLAIDRVEHTRAMIAAIKESLKNG